MKCTMTHGLYLRADGRMPCYCGAGETVTLASLPPEEAPADFHAKVWQAGNFAHIRRQMSQGLTPWPGICDQCTYLEPDAPFDGPDDGRTLEWFHWEPSYLCNLNCEWCRGQRSSDAARNMDPGFFRAIVEDLARAGVRLKMGNICGVGEPTLNPTVWEQVRLAKQLLGGDILLSTNGNGPHSPDIVGSGLTKLKIAIDAVGQEDYARYRERGQLSRVLRFSEAVAADKARLGLSEPIIIWQYILFNHNDSDRDLLTFQQMALDHGVDRIRFVHTRCNNYSSRTSEELPITFPDVIFLPINQYSRITSFEARRILEQVESLAAGGSWPEAASRTIRLVNRIYHRLALGVATYRDLLRLAGGVCRLRQENGLDLPAEDLQRLAGVVGKGFALLERAYREMGNRPQAEAYARYRREAPLQFKLAG